MVLLKQYTSHLININCSVISSIDKLNAMSLQVRLRGEHLQDLIKLTLTQSILSTRQQRLLTRCAPTHSLVHRQLEEGVVV